MSVRQHTKYDPHYGVPSHSHFKIGDLVQLHSDNAMLSRDCETMR